MFNWYAVENDKAFAGMKADSTLDVCDSFASEGGVNPGECVIRGTDKARQIKTLLAWQFTRIKTLQTAKNILKKVTAFQL